MLVGIAKAIAGVVVSGLALLGIFTPQVEIPDISVGGDVNQFVGGEVYKLAGSGVSAAATSITLTEFKVPDVGQANVQKLQITDFGTVGYGTIEPGTSRREFISFTGITQNADDSATLTGVSRGLAPISPYTASSTFQIAHSGGSRFIISNPPQLYNQAAFKENDETIAGLWSFDADNPPQLDATGTTATSSAQLVSKEYVDNTTNQGAATSTESVGGIVELGTLAEQADSTDNGANQPTVLQTKNSTSTCQVVGSYNVVASSTTGKIDKGCIDGALDYTFSGDNTYSGISTFSATTSISASDVNNNALTLNGVNYAFPDALGASSTVPSTDASGNITWNSLGNLLPRAFFIKATTTVETVADTTTETTYGDGDFATLTGGLMGSTGALKLKLFVTALSDAGADDNITFKVKLGGTEVCSSASIKAPAGSLRGVVEFTLASNNSDSAQVCLVSAEFAAAGTAGSAITQIKTDNTSSVDTSSDRVISLTAQWSQNDGGSVETLTMDGLTAEFLGRQ